VDRRYSPLSLYHHKREDFWWGLYPRDRRIQNSEFFWSNQQRWRGVDSSQLLESQSYQLDDEGSNCASNSAPVMFLVSLAKE